MLEKFIALWSFVLDLFISFIAFCALVLVTVGIKKVTIWGEQNELSPILISILEILEIVLLISGGIGLIYFVVFFAIKLFKSWRK